MSLLYEILKPIVKNIVKKKAHQEETYEEFVKTSLDIQAKFRLKLPRIKGYTFHDEMIGDYHCLVGRKLISCNEASGKSKKAVMYLVGGGERRWQMPSNSSMKRYMDTGCDLWIPLYPLYPNADVIDEIEMISETHRKMMETYHTEDIIWLGFSAGADLIMATGRYIVKGQINLAMPGLMIPVSPCNLTISDESFQRMKEIEKRAIMMFADSMKAYPDFYDHEHKYPGYIWGDARTDDYTGFPKIVMFFGGDEIFAAEAPEYEAAFIRSAVKDYRIIVKDGMFHAYPMFTFLKEGKLGEDEIIKIICSLWHNSVTDAHL